MRVLCINNKTPKHPGRLVPEDWIWEGEIYHVMDSQDCEDGLYYLLLEKVRLTGRKVLYHSNRFVPLTGEDTEELAEQVSTEKQALQPF